MTGSPEALTTPNIEDFRFDKIQRTALEPCKFSTSDNCHFSFLWQVSLVNFALLDRGSAPLHCFPLFVLGTLNGLLLDEINGQPKLVCPGVEYYWTAVRTSPCESVSLYHQGKNVFFLHLVTLMHREIDNITYSFETPWESPSPSCPPDPLRRVLVTGASSNHFHSLNNLLESVREEKSRDDTLADLSVVVFDLGLTADERASLSAHPLPHALHHFDFTRRPPHFALASATYAWKPAIVAEMLAEHDHVFWIDAGALVLGGLRDVFDEIAAAGFFSPLVHSPWTLGELTHPAALARLAATDLAAAPPVCAGAVGFGRGSAAHAAVAAPWLACAEDAGCIAPPGSSRANHRQDLSALSVLVHRAAGLGPTEFRGILFHQVALCCSLLK
jgi:hypothetical protein